MKIKGRPTKHRYLTHIDGYFERSDIDPEDPILKKILSMVDRVRAQRQRFVPARITFMTNELLDTLSKKYQPKEQEPIL